MKVFVTGARGQLGFDCVREIVGRGYEVVGSDVRGAGLSVRVGSTVVDVPCVRLDITDREAVASMIEETKPDAIVHCAAWTAVDEAEREGNRARVDAVNAGGARNVAEAAKRVDAKVLYVSSDYVFDGTGERPWKPDDVPLEPLNVYGRSKLGGEMAVSGVLERFFIVRTSWAFGVNGRNFVKTMIDAGKKRGSVRVVDDQIGTPTYALDLARLLVDLIETEKFGYYHATNEGGYVSWRDFCVEIYRRYGLTTEVVPVSTEEYDASLASRPKNSRLDKSKLVAAGFKPLPTWQDALGRYLKEANL